MRYVICGSVILGAFIWFLSQDGRESELSPALEHRPPAQSVAPPPKSPSVKFESSNPAPSPAIPTEAPSPSGLSPLRRNGSPANQGSRPEPKLTQLLLKDAEGKPLKLSHESAAQACASKGMRLPTIRELANLAKAKGAIGISHAPVEGEREKPEEKIEHVAAIDPDGRRDEFFYRPKGFRPDPNPHNIPEDPGTGSFGQQGHWLWSSSRSQSCPLAEPAKFCAYVFEAENGSISDKYDTVRLSASCVKEARSSYRDRENIRLNLHPKRLRVSAKLLGIDFLAFRFRERKF